MRHRQQNYWRRLVVHEVPTSTLICGESLMAQYTCAGLGVLLTDYDYYDGTQHWCYLITPAGSVSDLVSPPDTFGALQTPTVESAEQISFGCYGTNDRWTLTVNTAGFWSFHPAHITCRWNRFMFAKRYLTLAWTKGSAWSFPNEHPSH